MRRLFTISPIGAVGSVSSSVANAAVSWNVGGTDQVCLQLVASAAWPVGLVLTAEVSVDGTNWSGFPTAVTYAAAGVQHLLTVRGCTLLRVRVSTTAGAITVTIPANGIKEAE